MTHPYLAQLPRLEDIEPATHTEVLVADSRVDQGRIRAAVDTVFDAHPALGSVIEPIRDTWTSRPGGGWGWGVEPPGGTVAEVIARHRSSFDMHTGRMFAVSFLPSLPEFGCARDRLVLTASRLCIDEASWQAVVEDLIALSARTLSRA